jgi:hypothetical protein
MVRPGSCVRPAGVSPVPVSAGALGSGPRFVGGIWRAERGVKSLFGGSKCAGRCVKRTWQPCHSDNGKAEPLVSRRRPGLFHWVREGGAGFLGVGAAARAHGLTRIRRDPSAPAWRRAETGRIGRW